MMIKYNMSSIIEIMNNGVLGGRSAMPQKGANSTNESQFSMNRVLFTKTFTTNNTANTKLYYGARNSDASSVTQRRNISTVGGKNTNGEDMSLVGGKGGNDVRNARKRVRNSGAVAPAKKFHNYDGAPVFY